jgi:hypothetical protein
MANHSLLPPSSASRRVACAGSRAMESLYPRDDSPSAREGTAAHWVAMKTLNNDPVCIGEIAENGEIITTEMVEGAALYADCVNQYLNPTPDIFLTEVPLTMSEVHPLVFGTADCIIFGNGLGLHVWDYKFGHKYVEANTNWQLIYYAIGACETFKIKPAKITLWIVQPRYFGPEGKIRKWEIQYEGLELYADMLKIVEAEAMQENPRLCPSSECTYCAARHACPALQNTVLNISDFSKTFSANDLTPAQVGKELRFLLDVQKLLTARITGLSILAENMISSGQRVPYFSLKSGRGSTMWKKSFDEIVELAKLYNVEVKKSLELITPKQAVDRGLPEFVLKEYAEFHAGELKLVEDKKC